MLIKVPIHGINNNVLLESFRVIAIPIIPNIVIFIIFFKYYCISSNHPIHPLEFLVPLMHPPDLISSPPCLDFESQSK